MIDKEIENDLALENHKNPRLKPARNYRRTVVRCCGSCKHYVIIDGWGCCRRPGGKGGDPGDCLQWEYVCDGWQKRKINS